jgi:hypothetical protein
LALFKKTFRQKSAKKRKKESHLLSKDPFREKKLALLRPPLILLSFCGALRPSIEPIPLKKARNRFPRPEVGNRFLC